MLFAPYLFAGYYQPSFIAMSSLSTSVAAPITATYASEALVLFHVSRGETFSPLFGACNRGKRSVLEVMDQIHTGFASLGVIAEGVQAHPSGLPQPLLH